MKPLVSFAAKRPVFTSMIGLIVLLVGFMSLSRLPLDLLPDIEFPVISVSTAYPNAGPEEVEQLLTRPIEQTLAGVPGVSEMLSTSSEGNSNVTLQFVWGTDLSEAASDVRDRLDRILGQLPDEADRPFLRKFDPNQAAIVVLGVASNMEPIGLRRLLEQQIQPRLEQIAGVAVVDIRGGLEREIRIELDLEKMQALGLSLEQVERAIRSANVTQPAGELVDGSREILLRTPALLETVEDIASVQVAQRNGAPIYIQDIATVRDTIRDVTRIIRTDGLPGVRLAVRKQSGANTVEVAQAVRREIDHINRDYSQVSVSLLRDNSRFIERSLANVALAILVGSVLAVSVLIFFLRSWRSTIAIAIAIPLSLIATFVLIYFGNMSLNLFSLGGLALGVGMMVDSAIVVIENIYRKRQEGNSREDAAINGAAEVGPAITASTLTTMAIFLPLFFLDGITGLLFQELAYVVAFALFCSLFAAMTMVPMLSANLPGRETIGKDSLFRRFACRIQDAIAETYQNLLEKAFAHRKLVLLATLFVFLGSFLIISRLGTEFFPESDEGQVRVTVEMDRGTRIELMDERLQQIEEKVLAAVPEIQHLEFDVGATAWRPGAGSTGRLRANLVPRLQRTRSSQEIATDLSKKLADIPGVRIRVRASGELFVFRFLGLGGDEGERLNIEVLGFNLDSIEALAGQVASLVQDIEGVTDVRTSSEAGVPRLANRIDRERAADADVSIETIARSLQTYIGGRTIGLLRDGTGTEVDIQLRLREEDRMDIGQIYDLLVTNEAGETVSLRNLIQLEGERGAIQIQRRNQQRVVGVLVNVANRDLGSIVADIQDIINQIPRSGNEQILIRGDYEEQQKAFRSLLISLILALLLVYMVMACLYESLRNPFIVMFAVPLASIGAFLALYITGSTLNVQSFIGLIMLIGIVVNNAILIVDQASRNQKGGMSVKDAAVHAGRIRLRPVLMTMLTTVLALSPLTLGIGEGGETQASLARVVVGGLLSSSLITLIVIPLLYTIFHRDKTGRNGIMDTQ